MRMFSTSRGLDSFDQYLQDVEKYPLIQDPEEERALARRARSGDKEAAERLVVLALPVRKTTPKELGVAKLETLVRLKSPARLGLRHVLHIVRAKQGVDRRAWRFETSGHWLALTRGEQQQCEEG